MEDSYAGSFVIEVVPAEELQFVVKLIDRAGEQANSYRIARRSRFWLAVSNPIN